MSQLTRFAVVAFSVVGVAVAEIRADIQMFTLDEDRIGTVTNANGSINFNFATGAGYATIRNATLDPANFGPGGTLSSEPVNIAAGPAITFDALLNVDVVTLNLQSSILSADELCILECFVRQGGGLVAYGNGAPGQFTSILGAVAEPISGLTDTGTTNAVSPVLDGPIRTVAPGTPIAVGANTAFSDLGLTGLALLIQNATGDAIGASFDLDLGNIVIWGDEELFLDPPSVNGIAAALLSDLTRDLFLQSVAAVLPDSPFQFNPTLCDCFEGDDDDDDDGGTPGIPAPAALPAGLALLGLAGIRRRR